MRFHFFLPLFAVLCVCFTVHAHAALSDKQVNAAEKLVGSLASDAIGFLSDENLTYQRRTSKFKNLLNSKFDMRSIGRFAMGRYWRTTSSKQKDQYLKLFNERVIASYSRRFEEYQGQDLSIVSARAEGKRDAIVSSVMTQVSGPEVNLDWRVRRSSKTGAYKVIDVIVEGVSMALTQRSDFSSVIQRGGGDVDVLIAHLQDNK